MPWPTDSLELKVRQLPAIVEFAWLDSSGKEQVRTSREYGGRHATARSRHCRPR
jgi:hypothetical protein